MVSADSLSVIEAAYWLESHREAWLLGLLRAARAELGLELGASAYEFRLSAGDGRSEAGRYSANGVESSPPAVSSPPRASSVPSPDPPPEQAAARVQTIDQHNARQGIHAWRPRDRSS